MGQNSSWVRKSEHGARTRHSRQKAAQSLMNMNICNFNYFLLKTMCIPSISSEMNMLH